MEKQNLISQREVIKRYNSLMKDVAENDFYKIDLTNRVNCYTCQSCGHITKTKDIHAGVTPFMFECEKCNQVAYSSFYNDIAPHLSPTFEWYRPDIKECLKLRSKPNLLEHILQGGLDARKIKATK